MNKLDIDREMAKRQKLQKKKQKQFKDQLSDRTCANVMNRCLSYQVIWF